MTAGLTEPPFHLFIIERIGPKWVMGRRWTDRLKRQYPDSVLVTPKQYKAIEADYRRAHGHPYDPTRAAMYKALLSAKRALEFQGRHLAAETCKEIDAAIALELASP